MSKDEALKTIDEYKNKLINPVDMLCWTWLRVIINQIPDDEWDGYVRLATKIMSRLIVDVSGQGMWERVMTPYEVMVKAFGDSYGTDDERVKFIIENLEAAGIFFCNTEDNPLYIRESGVPAQERNHES